MYSIGTMPPFLAASITASLNILAKVVKSSAQDFISSTEENSALRADTTAS